MADPNNTESAPERQPSQDKEGTPTSYTIGTPEYEQHINELKSQWGRDFKSKETEITTLKGSVTSLTSERDSLKTDIDGLKEAAKTIEDAGGDAAELQKRIKDLVKRERELTARELTISEREKLIRDADLAANATSMATKFKENDPERLIKLARKAIRTENGKPIYPTEDEIKELAVDILGWTTKETKTKEKEELDNKPGNAPDSGLGSGALEKPKENDGRDHIAKGLKNWK